MASYTTLQYGSKGDDVKKMQQSLIDAGYDLGSSGADGVYGSKTLAAVKQYQQANGLGVDGIAGNQTLGKLYGSAGTAASGPTGTETIKSAADMLKQYEQNKPAEYVSPYAAQLEEYAKNKPADYQSPWTEQIDALYNQIVNREPFQYNFAADPMYQQYADQYQQKGQQAMRDTMGQAAALTGGYGSSYGQMVGQQAYDNYLQGMNDVIPQLRDAAYQMYQNEAAGDVDALNMLMNRDSDAYGKYRDQLSDYYNAIDLLMSRDQEAYNRYRDDLDDYYAERDYWYGKAMDEAALAAAAASGSGGGGGGSSGKSGNGSGDKLKSRDSVIEEASKALSEYGTASAQRVIDSYYNKGLLSASDASWLYTWLQNQKTKATTTTTSGNKVVSPGGGGTYRLETK